jgi:hypothetical protein
MEQNTTDLKRFARRVRLVRSWRGMAIGACFGSLAAAVWAGLDWANVAYAEWNGLGAVVAAGAVLGLFAGLFQRIPSAALADSIDRRGDLEDRLATSIERKDSHGGFDEALHADARDRLKDLKPAKLYPVRFGRWHAGTVALAVIASAIFILGNSPILLNDQQRSERKELEEKGKAVERVIKPLEEHMKAEGRNPDEERLAEELRRLSKELKKGRINKEEALQKANELQKEAEKLVQDQAQKTQKTLADAESAFDKMLKEQMEKNGIKDIDPEMAKMTPEERAAMEKSLQAQQDSLQSQIDSLKSQLQKGGLDKETQMQLSKELQDLLNQQSALSKKLQQLELSKSVQDMLKRMMENPLYKKLLEAQKKLQEAMKEAQQNGEQQELSHEQIEELKKALEDLAKQLKDDKAMSEYLQKLLDSMKDACGT